MLHFTPGHWRNWPKLKGTIAGADIGICLDIAGRMHWGKFMRVACTESANS
jgi:hypothetical protein